MDEVQIATVRGPLTLNAALESEVDILPTLTALERTVSLRRNQLEARRSQIEDLISHHLNIPSTKFSLSPSCEWIYGGFNICLPIDILGALPSRLPRTALIRFAMPHAVGEADAFGMVEKKTRCEAATYTWLERDCPTIPIPRLLGIGFPGSRSFTRIENESWFNWAIWHVRHAIMWFQGGTLPPFFAHDRTILPNLSYLLLEYVEDGKMLSSSWREHREDPQKRKNLYSSLARIMLDLSKVPLPRIGSWTMDNKGAISLTNRPFHDLTAIWNRHGIPLHVPRNLAYSSAESYIHDLLGYQDIRMRYQLNSLLDRNDGISQLSSIVGLWAILPQLYKSRLTRETFTMNFPELHQSNIFVDEDWNISRIIDFEFAYSCPSELIHVPSWLTSRGVDQLGGPDEEEYKILYDQFVEAVATQETLIRRSDATSKRLREDWTSGRLWYSIALGSLNGFPTVFGQHLRPRFYKTWDFYVDAWPLAQMWAENVLEFLDTKVRELPEYDNKVRQVFSEVAESQGVSKAQPAEAPLPTTKSYQRSTQPPKRGKAAR